LRSRLSLFPSVVAALILAPALLGAPGPAAASPIALATPPTGGLTQGLAGTSDPLALIEAQAFEVQSVWVLHSGTQQWLAYVPGAPAHVNTLTSEFLRADSIVTVRRAGELPPGSTLVLQRGEVAEPNGQANGLPAPPEGGLVQGVSGTNDPARLVDGQAFKVQAVWLLDVASQQWLSYVPGAPVAVNTLDGAVLTAESIVTVLRASTLAVAEAPAVEYDEAAEARLVALVNEARVARGLAPLEVDVNLRAVARLHSADMHVRDYFAHENPDGLDPFDRMRVGGITYRWAGENLARARSAERAHELLMESPGHRDNLLNERFGRIGIGAVETTNGWLFTQLFTD
jgi:uncharacterized protein YkwD